MTPFDRALQFTLPWEGKKFRDSPADDPIGGATKYGISFRFLKDLPLNDSDVDGDGVVTWKDVAALDPPRTERLYRKYFWEKIRGEELPGPLAVVLFDSAVNCGRTRVVRWAQYGLGVAQDGILGPKTLGTILGLGVSSSLGLMVLVRLVLSFRRLHYLTLSTKEWGKKNIKGWLARVDALEKEV